MWFRDSEGDADVIGGIHHFTGVDDVTLSCGCEYTSAEYGKLDRRTVRAWIRAAGPGRRHLFFVVNHADAGVISGIHYTVEAHLWASSWMRGRRFSRGPRAEELPLWGFNVLFWGRIGKSAEFVAAFVVLAELIGRQHLN
jgi:hypothetical protein